MPRFMVVGWLNDAVDSLKCLKNSTIGVLILKNGGWHEGFFLGLGCWVLGLGSWFADIVRGIPWQISFCATKF